MADRIQVARDLSPRALAGIDWGAGSPAGEMFFTVLAPGDELGVDAFLEMAMAAAMHAEADFFTATSAAPIP